MNLKAFHAILLSVTLLTAHSAALAEQETATAEEQYIQLGNDTVALLRELTGVLNTVTDKASADAAVPRVDAVSARMQELRHRAEQLPDLPENADMESEFRLRMNTEEVRDAVQQFMAALLQLAQTDGFGSEALISALTRMVSSTPM